VGDKRTRAVIGRLGPAALHGAAGICDLPRSGGRAPPEKPLGLKLHWLESETSIKLSDLPEDTQNRLKAGIPQTSVDDAQDTISKYRHQIDEEQTRQVIDAQTIRDNTNQGSASESDSEKTAEQSAEAEASDKN